MPNRPGNWAKRMAFLGRHATGVSLVAAFIVFLITLATSMGLIFQATIKRQSQAQLDTVRKLEAVSQDVGRALLAATKSGDTSCTRSHLLKLKRIVIQHHYVRGMGIYNAQGKIYCVTQLGKLPKPFKPPPTSFVTPSDFQVRLHEPALLFNRRRTLSIVRYHRYEAVIDPYVIRTVLDRYSGIIWFVHHGLIPLRVNPAYSAQLIDRMHRAAIYKKTGTYVDWSNLSVDIIRAIPRDGYVFDGNLVFETRLTLAHALAASPTYAVLGVAVAALFSVLLFAALSPWARRFSTLAYKVRYLCSEKHVLCLYQPIVDLRTGRVAGCEVLMRLRDEKGIYLPGQSLPAIQAAGLTWRLASAVTATAFEEMAPYLRDRGDFRVAFNLFPSDIMNLDRLEKHFGALHLKHDTQQLKVTIEVLEHSIIGDDVADAVSSLKAAGYYVSIDDFGTGYSNLGILKKLQPDVLKIDRSFVFDMEELPIKSSLIPQIIGIARAIGASVVAEGIENEAQAAKLIELGVDYGQGYYYSKPLPIQEFMNLSFDY